MATYPDEDEQLEALKRWWQENGNTLLISVAVVVVALFSWNQWSSAREARAQEASDLYQQMMQTASFDPAEEISEEEYSTAESLHEQLRNDYGGTVYSRFAALFMARLLVDAGELDAAERELRWILDNPSLGFMQSVNEELLLAARLRLARVILAQGDAEQALALLEEVEPGEFAGGYAEVAGDAHMILGQEDQAQEAYERAARLGGGNNVLVELKLRDLGAI